MLQDRALRKQLVEKYRDEQVFVVPFESVTHIQDKFTPSDNDIKTLDSYDKLGRYVLRCDAEHNPSLQQLIPYVLVMNKKGDKYYVSKRIAGDDRLIDDYSLGFGGHINPCDGSVSVLLKALHRELNEELDIAMIDGSIKFIGNVRGLTSSTPDHLGFVFTIKSTRTKIKEKDKLKGLWMTKEQLIDNYFHFEGWSKHIIDHFFTSED